MRFPTSRSFRPSHIRGRLSRCAELPRRNWGKLQEAWANCELRISNYESLVRAVFLDWIIIATNWLASLFSRASSARLVDERFSTNSSQYSDSSASSSTMESLLMKSALDFERQAAR